MKTPNFRRNRVTAAVAGAILALGATQAFGTGFQLNENSASSLGNAFAGGAAFTDDVTAMWWNPAALSQFPRMQGAAALHIITPSIKFRNDASQNALNQPIGNDGGDAGGFNYVPNMYVSVPINAQWTFGLGINAPFGLTTEYDDGWLGRYQALKSQIKTINVNPAISWKVTPEFAVGVGVNYQHIDATLTQQRQLFGCDSLGRRRPAAAGQIPAALVPAIIAATPGLDSKQTVTGDDDAWGWNIGFAWDATPALRVAASYRSEIKYDVKANVDFNNPVPPLSLPPGTSAPVAGAVNLLATGINSHAPVRERSHVGHHDPADRQRVVPLEGRPAMGGDGRRAVHGLVEHSRTQVHADRRLRVLRDTAQLGRLVEVLARHELPLQQPVEGAFRYRVRPDACHQRSDGTLAGLRPLVVCDRRRVQVDAELEVRRRLRLHQGRQPELQPEQWQHGGKRLDQWLVRCEHDDPLAAGDLHVLASPRGGPRDHLEHNGRGNPAVFLRTAKLRGSRRGGSRSRAAHVF